MSDRPEVAGTPASGLLPAGWLTSNRHLLPASGDALDWRVVVAGTRCGWPGRVFGRTRSIGTLDAVAGLRHEAAARGLTIVADVRDLESGDSGVPAEAVDVIVVVHYLHRPLFPHLLAALRPGRGARLRDLHDGAGAARQAEQPGVPAGTG